MRALIGYLFGIGMLLVAARFGLLFADNLLELRRLDVLHARAQAQVEVLEQRNQALQAEALALDTDPFYVELAVRRNLRWVRPDEVPSKIEKFYERPGSVHLARMIDIRQDAEADDASQMWNLDAMFSR